MTQLEVLPGIGLGSVLLGMTPAEVLQVFSEEQVYEEWMGGNLNGSYTFQGLLFHFSDCDSKAPLPDSKLVWIQIHGRNDVTLFGRSATEWTSEELIEELKDRDYTPVVSKHGDVDIPDVVGFAFSETQHLDWIEIG